MLRLVVVDDEAPARARLRELLGDIAADLPHQVVGEAANGAQAVRLLEEITADVVLLDIHMPEMDGIEVARHLVALERPPAVVFVTAHDEHAIAAFEVNAIDYLLKPARSVRLLAALRKAAARGGLDGSALRAVHHTPRRYLSVTERGRIHLVPVADVLYLKAEQKYVTLRTAEREFLLDESLAQLEDEFADRFLRIHRNCLVARGALVGFERQREGDDTHWTARLRGVPEPLPISRRQWPILRELNK